MAVILAIECRSSQCRGGFASNAGRDIRPRGLCRLETWVEVGFNLENLWRYELPFRFLQGLQSFAFAFHQRPCQMHSAKPLYACTAKLSVPAKRSWSRCSGHASQLGCSSSAHRSIPFKTQEETHDASERERTLENVCPSD